MIGQYSGGTGLPMGTQYTPSNAYPGAATSYGNPAATVMGAAAVSGLISGIASAYSQQAAGYYQQAGYAVQAQENLRLAGLRADKVVEYGEAAYERNLLKIEYETLNYKIQANTLLKGLRQANATALARGYASGVVGTQGSIEGIRGVNVREVYQDVGISDLNAMTARILGLEDATAMLQASYDNAFYEREAAIANASTLDRTGQIAVESGGLLSGIQVQQSISNFAMTYPFQYSNIFGGN
jgi:hypothetical protein